MSKKIVIIGALGYLGTELCRIYSGESWKNKIVALDNRFLSERVFQLNQWGIEFFQGSILDKNFLDTHLANADVVHHLAGVTNVAYVKSEANKELDQQITEYGVIGTRNVLNSLSTNCKIIFPSTHVVFEGLKKVQKNLKENNTTYPILTYAKSKSINEKEIKDKSKNYIILRLGSVYGYSHDSMRINIMPNLFSKMTSQNNEIKLFGNGRQFKSLVNVIDVVRCMKFFEEKNKYKNQLYHLVNEQITVKKVAEICKKINSNIKLLETNDEVPNEGYTLSNEKLLKTGFKFLYNLESSLSEMISKWKFEKNNRNLEEVFGGQNEFKDSRGVISNFELPEPINLVGYIHSKKNTVRANHYHPIQEQKCLVIKGQFISVYQDLLNKDQPIVTHVVDEKELIVTKPNVAHAMIFTKDCIFLNLVRGEREHQNYGITHTIPHLLVDEKIKKNIMNYYQFSCRSCGNLKLKRVISLGLQPLANNLIKNNKQNVDCFPLEMNFCEKCYNCQLSVSINQKKMFDRYYYLSSTSKKFAEHFDQAAINYIKEFNLKKNSYVIDVGCNDGIGLMPFKKRGFKNLLGIEPAKNLKKVLMKKKLKIYSGYLNTNALYKIKKNADLILASNVFAHANDLKLMADCMIKLLSQKGTIVIEVQYLVNTLKDLTFDNIYHEHFNYWSLTSLVNFFNFFPVKIYKVKKINTHGGSIRVYISKMKNKKVDKSVGLYLKEEKKFGIHKFSTYQNFESKIKKLKLNTKKNLEKIKQKNKLIIGYGAPAKATTKLNYYNIKNTEIQYIIDDNKLKKNRFVPGTNIKIVSSEILNDYKKIDKIIVFAWNFFDEIKSKYPMLKDKFVSIKDIENIAK